MSQDIVVEVEARTAQGKNAARRVRTTGMVPGILYGLDRPPFAVKANARRIEEILRLESGRNTVFRLQLQGADQPRAVMIRDLQRDPVNDALVHVDFVRVDLAKRVQVEVPVRLIGVPARSKSSVCRTAFRSTSTWT
jgi:large subunit ribosomal protein L25